MRAAYCDAFKVDLFGYLSGLSLSPLYSFYTWLRVSLSSWFVVSAGSHRLTARVSFRWVLTCFHIIPLTYVVYLSSFYSAFQTYFLKLIIPKVPPPFTVHF